jgi:putative aldouronate transport system substrate-binding protein
MSAPNSPPPVKVRALRPFSVDGRQPIWHQSQGFNGLTAIKKSSPERVRELLRILNYLAAPFGSQEYHLLNFGVRETDFTLDEQGNPVLTPKGPWAGRRSSCRCRFCSIRPTPRWVKAAYADEQAMVPIMIPDPSIGLYSPTDLSMSGTLTNSFFDGIGELVTGRSPLSNLDQLLKDWRSAGGDRIRGEFEKAYAESRG